MINRIEQLIDVPRVKRLKKEFVTDEKVRLLAAQAESVYVTALMKSIIMCEVDHENPRPL